MCGPRMAAWDHHEHPHTFIGLVTPAACDVGCDFPILSELCITDAVFYGNDAQLFGGSPGPGALLLGSSLWSSSPLYASWIQREGVGLAVLHSSTLRSRRWRRGRYEPPDYVV